MSNIGESMLANGNNLLTALVYRNPSPPPSPYVIDIQRTEEYRLVWTRRINEVETDITRWEVHK